jgi:RNA polymerase primary sigma factor
MSKVWTESDVLKILELMRNMNIESLDREITSELDDSTACIGDLIEDTGPSPQEIIEQKELHQIIIEAISKLPPRQMKIINLRFGIIDGNPKTLEEVGQLYGVTRERIRQIERKALEKLRWLLITKYKITGGNYETK